MNKRVQQWIDIRDKELIPMFQELGIYTCEIHLPGCMGGMFTGFAHRHKRIDYYKHPAYLGDYNQVVVACQSCHSRIEGRRGLTEEVFTKLRGIDNLPKS